MNTPEIYVINSDGTGLTRLTNDGFDDYAPHWSPDGTKIVFNKHLTGPSNNEIFVMNADGTNPVDLTNNPGQDARPSWSPDGKRIVFHRQTSGFDSGEIFT